MHGIGKGLDPNVLPEKQVIKSITTSAVKGVSQIKLGLVQGRAALRWKIKTPFPPTISKPIVKLTEKTNSTCSKYKATRNNFESLNTRKF